MARFSAAAGTYQRHADLQRRVANKLMQCLPARPAPDRVLEIGCGTGVLTALLADSFPAARIDAVDASRAMTDRARACLGGNRRISWIVQDACHLPENTKYPLIVSNCALHWISPVALIIEKLGALLRPKGRLAFAIMLRGTLGELAAARHRTAPHKPPRIILPDARAVRRDVTQAGLKITMEKNEKIRDWFPSPEQMLRRLHDQGLTGGNIPRHGSLLTRSEMATLITDYARHYKCKKKDNGVYASYRVYYCVAVKKK